MLELTIIVLTFERLDYTKRCLASVKAHRPEGSEVIVVDNASTDGTREYLHSEVARWPGFRIVFNERNEYPGGGYRAGLRAMNPSRFVFLCDNDGVLVPGWFEIAERVFDQIPELGLLSLNHSTPHEFDPREDPVTEVAGETMIDTVKIAAFAVYRGEVVPALLEQWTQPFMGRITAPIVRSQGYRTGRLLPGPVMDISLDELDDPRYEAYYRRYFTMRGCPEVFDRRVAALRARRRGAAATAPDPSLVDGAQALPATATIIADGSLPTGRDRGPRQPGPVPPPGDFDRFERFYQESLDYYGTHRTTPKIGEILRTLIPSGCRSLLDVGCGTGLFTTRLAELGIPRVVGVDVSETAIRSARALGSTVEFHALNASELDRLEERFDVVLMAGVLNYMINDDIHEQVIRDVSRLLNTGGRLICTLGTHPERHRPKNITSVLERDFDVESELRWSPRGGEYGAMEHVGLVLRRKSRIQIMTSWDDGTVHDLRVAEMLDRYGVPGTFYPTPTTMHAPRLTEAQIEELSGRFEIGAHSITHPRLPGVPRDDAWREITGSKAWVEDVTGRPARTFCFPYGELDDDLVEMTRQAGFAGVCTTDVGFTRHPTYIIRPTISLSVARHQAVGTWGRQVQELVKSVVERGDGYLHVRGHSASLEADGLWEATEELLRALGSISRSSGSSSVTSPSRAAAPVEARHTAATT